LQLVVVIQHLIRQWGNDQVVNVGQRARLYRVIDKLEVLPADAAERFTPARLRSP